MTGSLTPPSRPSGGLLRWFRERREQSARVLLEDALHALYEAESQGLAATAQGLRGSLGGRHTRLLRLIEDLRHRGLVDLHGEEIRLTPPGRDYALQVVRAHRLWERYFADEAQMPLDRVHQAAHHAEHRSSVLELDALDAHLGHPRTDPHGDPIPTASGEVSAVETTHLIDWPVGKPATVAHIEDEHRSLLTEAINADLHPGRVIRVEESGPEGVLLDAGTGKAIHLSPLAAANVQVVPGPEAIPEAQALRTLADLAIRERAEVVEIDPQIQGFSRRRLLDLGLTPGTRIEPDLDSAFSDLRAYRVRGTLVALRRDQASRVRVRPVDEARRAAG